MAHFLPKLYVRHQRQATAGATILSVSSILSTPQTESPLEAKDILKSSYFC